MKLQKNKMTKYFCAVLLGCFVLLSSNVLAAPSPNTQYLKLWAPPGWTFVPGSAVYGNTNPICQEDLGDRYSPANCSGVPYSGDSCASGFNANNTEYVIQDYNAGTDKKPSMVGPFFTIKMKSSFGNLFTLLAFKGGAANITPQPNGLLVGLVGTAGGQTFSQPSINSWVWQRQASGTVTGKGAPTDCTNSSGCAAVVQLFYQNSPVSNNTTTQQQTIQSTTSADCAPSIFPSGQPGFGG